MHCLTASAATTQLGLRFRFPSLQDNKPLVALDANKL